MNQYKPSRTPSQLKTFRINPAQLPLHCPTADTSLWNSHPRVFLPVEDQGQATCPYCGTLFILEK